MPTQRKGCGLLITAFVLFLIGGAISAYLGMNAFSSGKEFVEKIHTGTPFSPPETATYIAKEDGKVSVWLTGSEGDDLKAIQIQVTDNATGNTITATKPSGTSNVSDQHLVAKFTVKKGGNYSVRADGLEAGRTLILAEIDPNAIFSFVGKGLGAFFGGGAIALVALVLGIIGLVLFFTSKPAPQNI